MNVQHTGSEHASRPISMGFPSGKLKMTLWEGTEDEQSFQIFGMKTGKPYVKAYGVRYNLTEEEYKIACTIQKAAFFLERR